MVEGELGVIAMKLETGGGGVGGGRKVEGDAEVRDGAEEFGEDEWAWWWWWRRHGAGGVGVCGCGDVMRVTPKAAGFVGKLIPGRPSKLNYFVNIYPATAILSPHNP